MSIGQRAFYTSNSKLIDTKHFILFRITQFFGVYDDEFICFQALTEVWSHLFELKTDNKENELVCSQLQSRIMHLLDLSISVK